MSIRSDLTLCANSGSLTRRAGQTSYPRCWATVASDVFLRLLLAEEVITATISYSGRANEVRVCAPADSSPTIRILNLGLDISGHLGSRHSPAVGDQFCNLHDGDHGIKLQVFH